MASNIAPSALATINANHYMSFTVLGIVTTAI